MSGWLLDYSYKCQPVDYSHNPTALRVCITTVIIVDARDSIVPIYYNNMIPTILLLFLSFYNGQRRVIFDTDIVLELFDTR